MHTEFQNMVESYYLDYVNNYLTIEGFASGNGITLESAKLIIELGRKINLDTFLDY